MRLIAASVTVALGVAACGSPPLTPDAPLAPPSSPELPNPARIDRVRQDLPAGFEAAPIDTRLSPIQLWGFGSDWAAEPAQCAQLAAVAVDVATARGWSASGPGGIVHAGVARSTAPQDPALPGHCEQWTVSGGHARGTVTAVAAPAIDGARTVGMATTVTIVVEGGTETSMHADTFIADLDDYHCFIIAITDPGAPNAGLTPGFASGLLVKTVTALRG